MTGYLCRNARVARFFVGKEMHMNYEKLSGSIRAVIDRRPGDNGAYSDLFSLCREWETEDFSAAHMVNKELLALSADQVVRGGGAKFYEQWRRCLLFEAPHDFDSFMTYIELDRKPEKRFYWLRIGMLSEPMRGHPMGGKRMLPKPKNKRRHSLPIKVRSVFWFERTPFPIQCMVRICVQWCG